MHQSKGKQQIKSGIRDPLIYNKATIYKMFTFF